MQNSTAGNTIGQNPGASAELPPLRFVTAASLFDGHDAVLPKDLFGVVVDELAVDEHIDAVRNDAVALGAHLDRKSVV